MTDRDQEKARVDLSVDKVYLRMDCDFNTDNANFFDSVDKENWIQLGTGFHMIYNLKHFMGNRFAIYNYATKAAGGYVDVDYFEYAKSE